MATSSTTYTEDLAVARGAQVLNEIETCNRFLLQLTTTKKFHTIQPAMPIRYMYDDLHPSKYGIEMIEETIRIHLQK